MVGHDEHDYSCDELLSHTNGKSAVPISVHAIIHRENHFDDQNFDCRDFLSDHPKKYKNRRFLAASKVISLVKIEV